MNICLCYVAVSQGPITLDYCARFATTYHEYPPGAPHDTLVICNGGPLNTAATLALSSMSARMFPRENDGGWDVSAYIDAAKGPCYDYDAMLCLGESNYFHRAGWLKRLVDAWGKYGPAMYGPYASNAVRAHLNTTAFMCPPLLLRQYPERVHDRPSRYEFEHGERAMWRRGVKRGYQARLVTWDGEWEPRMWRFPKNILWRGDQSNLLMWCNHSDGYAQGTEEDRKKRRTWADLPFK